MGPKSLYFATPLAFNPADRAVAESLSSTTCTQGAAKATEFGEITQNKGYYVVQGHSRSPIFVPIESSYTTSY